MTLMCAENGHFNTKEATMSKITFRGTPVSTNGELPKVGEPAPDFVVVQNDLADLMLDELKGRKVVLNIFPSLDTGVCATSVRKFNEQAASVPEAVVLCVSKDLPFAQARFCGAEGIENVKTVSVFRCDCFEKNYGVLMVDGPLRGLLARSVVVLNEEGKILYTELVPEIAQEPNYDAALNVIRG